MDTQLVLLRKPLSCVMAGCEKGDTVITLYHGSMLFDNMLYFIEMLSEGIFCLFFVFFYLLLYRTNLSYIFSLEQFPNVETAGGASLVLPRHGEMGSVGRDRT